MCWAPLPWPIFSDLAVFLKTLFMDHFPMKPHSARVTRSHPLKFFLEWKRDWGLLFSVYSTSMMCHFNWSLLSFSATKYTYIKGNQTYWYGLWIRYAWLISGVDKVISTLRWKYCGIANSGGCSGYVHYMDHTTHVNIIGCRHLSICWGYSNTAV